MHDLNGKVAIITGGAGLIPLQVRMPYVAVLCVHIVVLGVLGYVWMAGSGLIGVMFSMVVLSLTPIVFFATRINERYA